MYTYIHIYIYIYTYIHYITLHYITLHYITLHYITLHTYIWIYTYTYTYIYIVTLHIYTCVIRYVWHISMDIYHVRRSTKVKLWILTSCHWGLRPVNQKGVTLYISVMSIDGNPVLKQPEWQMVQVHHLVAKARPSSLNGFRKRMPVHQRPCQFDMWNCGNPGMPQTNPKKPTSSWVHRVRQKPSPTKSTQHSPSQAFSQKTCLPLQEILPNLPWSKKCHRAIGESPAFFFWKYNTMKWWFRGAWPVVKVLERSHVVNGHLA